MATPCPSFAPAARPPAAAWLALPLLLLAAHGAAWCGPPALPTAPPPPKEVLIDPNAPEPPAAAVAPAPAGPPPDPVSVAQGRQLYKDLCQKCHGVDMVSPGGGFYDLRTFPADDKPRFVDSVTNGKRAMPAWGGVLKPAEIERLWAYVSSGRAP